MAIIFVIIEISSALWTQKYDETATIIQRQRIFENTSVTGLKLEIIFQEELHAHALS
jgi:hypothetical protein